MARNGERRATRMGAMIERLDVDPGALVRVRAGEAVAEARTKCLNCAKVSDCLRWLDAAPSSDPPLFCSNLPLFEVLKR
jgi:hypothetical protein